MTNFNGNKAFKNRALNINHKGNIGTPEISSGTELRNKL